MIMMHSTISGILYEIVHDAWLSNLTPQHAYTVQTGTQSENDTIKFSKRNKLANSLKVHLQLNAFLIEIQETCCTVFSMTFLYSETLLLENIFQQDQTYLWTNVLFSQLDTKPS